MSTIDEAFHPGSFEEFIGQPKLKRRIDVSVTSALDGDRPMPHLLLDGPPGAGKSTMALLVAARLDKPLVSVPQQPTPQQVMRCLFELDGGGVVFFDEIQTYSPSMQSQLLPLLEGGSMANKWGEMEFPGLTAIAATTDKDHLSLALIDRFQIQIRYEDYTEAEMAAIVRRFAYKAGIELDAGTCRKLGVASAGVPRVARSLVIAARDLSNSQRITADDVLLFAGIEPDGLTAEHLGYLQALYDNHGRAGLEVIRTRLRVNKEAVLRLERLLLDRRLVTLDTAGRILTSSGRDRLKGLVAA